MAQRTPSPKAAGAKAGQDRRRLTVGAGVEPPSFAGSGGEELSPKAAMSEYTRLKDTEIWALCSDEEREKKGVRLSSQTDRDRNKRGSFLAKDETCSGTPSQGQDKMQATAFLKEAGIGWACKKGLKPESPNQDSFSVVYVAGAFALYGVYDGHGPNGHDVSETVRDTLPKLFLKHPQRSDDTQKAFMDSFQNVQAIVEGLSSSKTIDAQTSGTTCTMVYHDLQRDTITVAHVGDSRAVLGKQGPDARAREYVHQDCTVDHKPNLPKEKARIESAKPPGRVVFDGFYNHRVFAMGGMYPGLNMSRAIGDIVAHKEAGLTAMPDVATFDLKEDRRKGTNYLLLVCSDGVWEFIESNEAFTLIKAMDDPAEQMKKLADVSWERWMKDSDNEISDDITGVIVSLPKY